MEPFTSHVRAQFLVGVVVVVSPFKDEEQEDEVVPIPCPEFDARGRNAPVRRWKRAGEEFRFAMGALCANH